MTTTLRTATQHWELNNRSEAYDYRRHDTLTANRLIVLDLQAELRVSENQQRQAEANLVQARSAYDRALANRG